MLSSPQFRKVACLPPVILVLGIHASAQTTWVGKNSGTIEYLASTFHGSGLHVAVGDQGAIVTSPDGNTWTPAVSGVSNNLRSVVHGEGRFVAAGAGGTILTSSEGTIWTPRISGTSAFLSGLAHDGETFVVVGGGGVIRTSADAVSWSAASSGTASFLQGVHYGGGLFIACGENGTILRSTNGQAWIPCASPTNLYLLGGSHFAGRHHLVGRDGVILSSSDGITWSLGDSGTLESLRGMASDGSTAVICGEAGTLMRSADGLSWTPLNSGRSIILAGVGFAAGRFITVGEPMANVGTILVAEQDPGIRWKVPSASVGEAEGTVVLRVDRLGAATGPVSASFQTVPGSAGADVDFTTTTGLVEFAAGEVSKDVIIPLVNNPEAEPPENFTVILSNPTPPQLTLHPPASATITIIDAQDSDNDGLPDDWELTHFPSVGSYGPGDDPDLDGNSNLRELAESTDPMDPESASYRLTLAVAAGSGTLAVSPELPSYPKGTVVTITPAASAPYSFFSWQRGASGSANPLEVTVNSDLSIDAVFGITLAEALDRPELVWSTSGNGAPWAGGDSGASDGIDAAVTGGLGLGQQSSVQTEIYGPATVQFHWRLSSGTFDRLRFWVGASPNSSLSGETFWQTQGTLVGTGLRTLRWTYSKESTSSAGTNQAWLDQVKVSYDFDSWKFAVFNLAEVSEPDFSGPEADPERDGQANLFEYYFNLDPKIPDIDPAVLPVTELVDIGEATFPALRWTRHRFRKAHLEAMVEFSPSLAVASWQPVAEVPEVLATQGPTEVVRIVHPNPVTTPGRGFFRLKLVLPPKPGTEGPTN